MIPEEKSDGPRYTTRTTQKEKVLDGFGLRSPVIFRNHFFRRKLLPLLWYASHESKRARTVIIPTDGSTLEEPNQSEGQKRFVEKVQLMHAVG